MRVEQTSTFLLDIVRGAASGTYGLAPFQRQYAWNKDDVEKLMKSLINRWPVGSFTTWTPPLADRDLYPTKGRLGPLEHPENVEALILDGQNRLASLIYASFINSASSNPAHHYNEKELEVWFGDEILVADCSTKSVAFKPRDQAWSATSAPFGLLMDAFLFHTAKAWEVYDTAAKLGMNNDDMNWIMDDLPSRVREARVTVTNLLNATFEEARDCYMTICRAGQPISDEEFDMAFSFVAPTVEAKTGPRP